MPIALYPVYLVGAAEPSVADYWRQFQALPFWPCGPQWFLWQLLILNIVAAALHKVYPTWGEHLGKLAANTRTDPIRFILILIAASALAYVPLALDLLAVGVVSVRRVRIPMVAGRCTTRSISSPAPRSEPTASIADCWRPTACWRGAGRSRSPPPSSGSRSG